jgi:CspA family cold shock protein
MATGEIVTMRTDKGFGFIRDAPGSNGSNHIFFHRSSVTDGAFEDLTEGQSVTYDAGPDPKDASRFRATNVRPVGTSDEG